MSRRLVELAAGLLDATDQRLAPDGFELDMHFVRVARRLAEAELALGRLDDYPSSTGAADDPLILSSAGFAAIEAALAFWGLAVRLAARTTGLHAERAAAPLREHLRSVAARSDGPEPGPELLGLAARSLALASPAVELAVLHGGGHQRHPAHQLPIEQLVATGVVSLLRIAADLHEADGLA